MALCSYDAVFNLLGAGGCAKIRIVKGRKRKAGVSVACRNGATAAGCMSDTGGVHKVEWGAGVKENSGAGAVEERGRGCRRPVNCGQIGAPK